MAEKVNSEILRRDWGFFLSILDVTLLLSALLLNPIQIYHFIPVKFAAFSHFHSHYLKVYFLFLRQNNKRNCIFADF